MTKVLIVDTRLAAESLQQYLLTHPDYKVKTAFDGISGLAQATEWKPDIIILEKEVPHLEIHTFMSQLRKDEVVYLPVFIYTMSANEIDKIVGLESGADGYESKAISFDELFARIHAILRLTSGTAQSLFETLSSGNLIVNPAGHVAYLDAVPLKLSVKELQLLIVLMRNKGNVLTHAQLDKLVWDDHMSDPRSLAVHIRWLRQKIEVRGSKPERILTVRGVGYRFVG